MIFWVLASISFFLAAIYSLGFLYATIQWLKTRTFEINQPLKPLPLSILIPFRNEEATILTCLNSLLNQKYPKELVEIICIDDHSTDRSSSIIQQSSFNNSHIKLIVNKGSGKKDAIRTGMEASEHNHILLTDADTTREENWLYIYSNLFRYKGIKVIVGTVLMEGQRSGPFTAMQELDYIGMMSLTITAIRKHWFVNASGANMAITKDIYLEYIDSTDDRGISSGDDVFLVQYAHKHHPGSILAPKNKDIIVKTSTENGWMTFFRQRIRWANKSFQYSNYRMTLIWAFIWFFHLSIIALFLNAVLFQGIFIKLLAFSIFSKLLADLIFLSATTSFYKKSVIKYFFISEVYHFIYVVFIGFAAIFKIPFSWKERKFSA